MGAINQTLTSTFYADKSKILGTRMTLTTRFKQLAITLSCCGLLAGATQAAPFTPGNVVVYRVGSGTGSLINTGNPVFLDEYTPAGLLIQSIPLPTTTSGVNRPLVASGTATSEGLITRSADGQFLLLTGYGSTLPGPGSLSGTTGTAVNRVVGRVAADGTLDTSTALVDFASGNNPRSAVSSDGNDIWVAGGAGGIRFTTFGATLSTQLAATPLNVRQVNLFSGQLYFSSGSSPFIGVGTVGTGTPTTSGQVATLIPLAVTQASPYSYFLADLTTTVPGLDTLYLADDSTSTANALRKYSLVGGVWVTNGTVGAATSLYRGLTGVVNGISVTLYSTILGGSGATGGGQLVTLTDTSGYNGALSGSPVTIATALTNTAFRGVATAPVVPALNPVEAWTSFPFSGNQTTLFGDVDGDRRADVVAVNTDSITVLRSTGSVFGGFESWSDTAFFGNQATVLADVDGDGREDIIALNSTLGTTVRRSLGTSFGPVESWTAQPFFGDSATLVKDVTGDGKADLVAFSTVNGVTVLRSNGTSFGDIEVWSPPFIGQKGTFLSDVDGDGKADAVVVNNLSITVRRSNGISFVAPPGTDGEVWYGAPLFGQSTFLADVNGDGLGDVVVLNSDSISFAPSNGKVFGSVQALTNLPFAGDRLTQVTDVTGDRKADVIAVTGSGISVRRAP